jgi:tetratricopeptide (TPR) repeat protein
MNKLFIILFAIILSGKCYCQTAEDYVKMGAACYNNGKYTEAIDNLDSALVCNSECCEAYIYLGLANANSGNYEDAIINLDLAIYLNPQSAMAFFYRGLLKYSSGRQKDYNQDIKNAFDLVWTNYLSFI